MGSGWLMTEPSLGAWMAPGGCMADKQHGQRCTVNQGMGVGRPLVDMAVAWRLMLGYTASANVTKQRVSLLGHVGLGAGRPRASFGIPHSY